MSKYFIIALFVLTLGGCASTVRPATDAVINVENLSCESCKPLQEKYFRSLQNISNKIPFSMKVDSLGFLEHKDKKYIAIDLIGSVYNSIQTTTATRLTNEFFNKYKIASELLLQSDFYNDIYGVRILLTATNYNFVSDKYGLKPKAENLELFTEKEIVQSFLLGDITAQDLINRSTVYVNGQRMDFELQMM